MLKKLLTIFILLFLISTILWFYFKPNNHFIYEVNNTMNYNQIHDFFLNKMISSEGGVFTNFHNINISTEDDITKGHYILSESQGLLMEYALLIDDKQLFMNTWNFLKKYMVNEDGSYVWRVSDTYEKVNQTTATIDDLQIVLQLIQGINKWNDLSNELEPYIQKLSNNLQAYTVGNYLINGYDTSTETKMKELDSSYIYFLPLKKLTKYNKNFNIVYKNGLPLIHSMKISHDFPFVYKRFFVQSEFIEHQTTINMIEALLVARNLAQIHQLDKDTFRWLKNNIDTGIYAYYNTNGEALTEMESSAVYALIAQVGFYENDKDLYEKALLKGEQLLISALNNPDKNEITSYDNLQMLIAYGLAKD